MRVNPYNWANQSRDHMEFAAQNYPTLSAVIQDSANYPAFALGVQALPGNARRRYLSEWNDWNNRFGRAWQKMGGIRERRFGQITSRYRVVPRGESFGSLGALAPPPAPTNYHICSSMPPGGISVTGNAQNSSVTGWRFREAMGLQGKLKGVRFYEVWDMTSPAKVYWYPNYVSCSGTSTSTSAELKNKIKELQGALNENGFGLAVDGDLGPLTCTAAYQFQKDVIGVVSHNLTGDFFLSLGLPSHYATILGGSCRPWYEGELQEVAKPSLGIEPDPSMPLADPTKVASAGMSPWALVGIGALILGGVLYASRNKKKARKK